MFTVPSETEPMRVWVRRLDPHLSYHPVAHLTPECGVFRGRVGDPVETVATHIRNTSTRTTRLRWNWVVRLPSRPCVAREHLDVRLCAVCLNRALDEGLVASPPRPEWWGQPSPLRHPSRAA